MLQFAMCQHCDRVKHADTVSVTVDYRRPLFSLFVNKTKVVQMLSFQSTKQFSSLLRQAGVTIPSQKCNFAQLPRAIWTPEHQLRSAGERRDLAKDKPRFPFLESRTTKLLRKTKLIWSLSKILACKVMQQNPNFGTAVIAFPS